MIETPSIARRKFLRFGVLGAMLAAGGCGGDEPAQVSESKAGGNRKRLDDLKEKTDSLKTKPKKK